MAKNNKPVASTITEGDPDVKVVDEGSEILRTLWLRTSDEVDKLAKLYSSDKEIFSFRIEHGIVRPHNEGIMPHLANIAEEQVKVHAYAQEYRNQADSDEHQLVLGLEGFDQLVLGRLPDPTMPSNDTAYFATFLIDMKALLTKLDWVWGKPWTYTSPDNLILSKVRPKKNSTPLKCSNSLNKENKTDNSPHKTNMINILDKRNMGEEEEHVNKKTCCRGDGHGWREAPNLSRPHLHSKEQGRIFEEEVDTSDITQKQLNCMARNSLMSDKVADDVIPSDIVASAPSGSKAKTVPDNRTIPENLCSTTTDTIDDLLDCEKNIFSPVDGDTSRRAIVILEELVNVFNNSVHFARQANIHENDFGALIKNRLKQSSAPTGVSFDAFPVSLKNLLMKMGWKWGDTMSSSQTVKPLQASEALLQLPPRRNSGENLTDAHKIYAADELSSKIGTMDTAETVAGSLNPDSVARIVNDDLVEDDISMKSMSCLNRIMGVHKRLQDYQDIDSCLDAIISLLIETTNDSEARKMFNDEWEVKEKIFPEKWLALIRDAIIKIFVNNSTHHAAKQALKSRNANLQELIKERNEQKLTLNVTSTIVETPPEFFWFESVSTDPIEVEESLNRVAKMLYSEERQIQTFGTSLEACPYRISVKVSSTSYEELIKCLPLISNLPVKKNCVVHPFKYEADDTHEFVIIGQLIKQYDQDLAKKDYNNLGVIIYLIMMYVFFVPGAKHLHDKLQTAQCELVKDGVCESAFIFKLKEVKFYFPNFFFAGFTEYLDYRKKATRDSRHLFPLITTNPSHYFKLDKTTEDKSTDPEVTMKRLHFTLRENLKKAILFTKREPLFAEFNLRNHATLLFRECAKKDTSVFCWLLTVFEGFIREAN